MSEIKTKESDELVQGMVSSILDGTITEESLGTALKALQIKMAASLVINNNKAVALVDGVSKYVDKLQKRFEEIFEGELETMTDTKEIMDWIERIHKIQLQTLEVQRKIVQGKELFNTSTLSPEEKLVSKLLNSFKTREKKEAFIKLVKHELQDNENNDFEE